MCRTRRSAVVGGLLTAVLVPLFVQPFVTSTMGQWAAETPSIGSPEVPPAGASLDAQIEAAPATQDGAGWRPARVVTASPAAPLRAPRPRCLPS